MSSYGYDKTTKLLHRIAGVPRAILDALRHDLDAIESNQASSIESSTIATMVHSVGEYIIYGTSKKFAKVTSAIAIGDTITNGTNVDDITQGEVLTALDNQPGYPDFSNVIKTLTTNSSYTATEDGWLCGFWYNSQANSYSHITVNGEAAGSAYTGTSSNQYYSYGNIQLPIKKGDVITTGSNFSGSVRFYGKRA